MTEIKAAVVTPEENGVIHIAEDVIASITALAATEVDGVGALAAGSSVDWNDLIGKKNPAKGVKLSIEDNVVTADISIFVKYGYPVAAVAQKVQENIKAALESMAGLQVGAVNVHVNGIQFEKK